MDGFPAGFALLLAFVFGHVLVKSGERTEAVAAERTIQFRLFLIVGHRCCLKSFVINLKH
jgi:hypothetical protein